MAKAASRVIVMKGKKVSDFDMKKDKPNLNELTSIMVGTTGNLRAPTIVRGKTVLVGFNQEIFDGIFG